MAAAFWTYDRDAEDDIDIHFGWGNPATGEWEEPRPTGISGQIAKPVVLQDGVHALQRGLHKGLRRIF